MSAERGLYKFQGRCVAPVLNFGSVFVIHDERFGWCGTESRASTAPPGGSRSSSLQRQHSESFQRRRKSCHRLGKHQRARYVPPMNQADVPQTGFAASRKGLNQSRGLIAICNVLRNQSQHG